MIRSLRFKWGLTLVITSLVGIVLVGVLATQVNVSEYQRFRDAELQAQIADTAARHFSQFETWDGIEASITNNMIPLTPRRRRNNDHSPRRISLIIADTSGTVVKPDANYRIGDQVTPDDLQRGMPIMLDNQQVGTLIIVTPPEFDEAELNFLQRTNLMLLIGATVAVAVAVLLGWLLSRQFLRPLAELTDAIGNVRQGKFDQRVPVRSNDELGQLAQTFNQMGEELQSVNQLRRQMTADIAHDLRTPLTVISGYLEGLRDGSLKPTQARFDTLYQEAQLLNRLIEDLRTLSLADAGELNLMRQTVQPRDLLEQVIVSFTPIAEAQQISLVLDADDHLPDIKLDRDRMIQVIGNLVSNSLRFTPESGTITLSAHQTNHELILKVSDTGSGISQEHLDNIFERFYRGSESRHQQQNESGLGLAIAKSIVTAHNGQITADSQIGQGTTITITLPYQTS